jgi:hypothetical protein
MPLLLPLQRRATPSDRAGDEAHIILDMMMGHAPDAQVPRPVAVAAGELVEEVKDSIKQKDDQRWLVSFDARALMLSPQQEMLLQPATAAS